MRKDIEKRALTLAEYIIKTHDTIRQVAKEFGMPKSSVYTDLALRLPELNPNIAHQVREILNIHLIERSKNGGRATQNKLRKIKQAQTHPLSTSIRKEKI